MAALFVIAKNRKSISNDSIQSEQKNQTQCGLSNAVEYDSAAKKEKPVTQTITWMNPNNDAE